MKKFVALVLTIFLCSCSVDDNTANTNYELAAITGNDLPAELVLGETYEVRVDYQLPSDCNQFQTVDARRQGNAPGERNKIYVSIVTSVTENDQCHRDVLGPTGSNKFMITIDEEEDYTFYFWTGNTLTENEYKEVTIPVVTEATETAINKN